MNIFYYDVDKIPLDKAIDIYDKITEKFGDTVALPRDSYLLLDCRLNELKYIRDILDKAIEKKEKEEGA
jgi:hypothetical protein